MPPTIVVKVGTSTLTHAKTGDLALSNLAQLVEALTQLKRQDYRLVLVSSGAVGVGRNRLGLTERPRTIALKQAVAAVGQGRLMRIYDDLFTTLNQPIAQVLLTRRDLVQRNGYINAYNTFQQLLRLNVIPIVNENDTVAVEELKFGDNDTLSALVASLVEADWLFLLTDVDKLYSADPNSNPNAQPIDLITHMPQLLELQVEMGNSQSGLGTGGMITKIEAARIATSSGVRVVITDGKQPGNIQKVLQGEHLGTHFLPNVRPVNARKHWIAHVLIPLGKLYLDAGAIKAICQKGKSLLAAGIIQIEGQFRVNDPVQLCDAAGSEVARGLVNYSSTELEKIQGCQSEKIAEILGYSGAETAVHRDNLVVARD